MADYESNKKWSWWIMANIKEGERNVLQELCPTMKIVRSATHHINIIKKMDT